MTKTTDKLLRELEKFDPVTPGDLEDAREGAARLLERVLFIDPADAPDPGGAVAARGPRLRGIPVFVALAAVAIALIVLLIGLPQGGRGEDDLTVALDRAAAAAAVRSTPVADLPYTYLETRQLETATQAVGDRSWSVLRRSTRQEWVGWDGSGRLRVAIAPERFADPAARAEWRAAGSPRVFGLGSERRSEDRWIETGLLDAGVEELPTGPATLAARLRDQARTERSGTPLAAAILDRVAADLRSPAASPGLRQALYRAAALTPGVEYLGPTLDPEGRDGVAIGVTGSYRGVPSRYSLIFDPRTSGVLATETTALEPEGADGAPVPPLRATVYLDSHGADSPSPRADTWLADYEPSALEAPPTSPFLVYRIPEPSQWARTVGDAFPAHGRLGR